MSFTRFFFNKPVDKTIDTIEFDSFISENFTSSSSVTSYPVEDGADISDHVKNDTDEINVIAFISNSAINIIDYVKNFDGNPKPDRVADTFNRLQELRAKKTPVKIVTGLKVYENVIIQNVVVNRDFNTANGMPFNITLKEISIVQSQETEIANTSVGGDDTTEKQANKDVDAGTTTDAQNLENPDDIVARARSFVTEGTETLLGQVGG